MDAVIYSRISDDPTGRAAGVERQADECRALAAAHGLNVIEELVDNDLSATSGKHRPGYERALELVREGKIDTIVIWHTDRLYRLPRDLEPIIELADGRRLRFLTVEASEIDLNTPSGRMAARILAAVSAQEVEHKAARQKAASDQRAAKGLPTARPGYGYRREAGVDVIEPVEASVIRETARRIVEGESLRGVATDLNGRQIPSPGGSTPWQPITIRQMLGRPSLAGLRTHRGIVVGEFDKAAHPAILDADTHARIVALFSDPGRKTSKGGPTPKHLLSGLAHCGRCGDTLGGRMKRLPGWTPKPGQKSKPSKPAYACSTCHKVRRLQEPVDAMVEEVVLRRLERPDAADLFAQGDPLAVQEARDAISGIDARLATAADQFADGVLTGDQLRRITERLRADREQRERTIAASMPAQIPTAILAAGRAREVWADLHIDSKRAIIDALMTVTVLPLGVARANTFDPESVQIVWR